MKDARVMTGLKALLGKQRLEPKTHDIVPTCVTRQWNDSGLPWVTTRTTAVLEARVVF